MNAPSGGVTLNYQGQKTIKAKSIAAGSKQKMTDGGVYQIMPTQTQQYQRKAAGNQGGTRSSLNYTQTSNLNESIRAAKTTSNMKARDVKQFFVQKSN